MSDNLVSCPNCGLNQSAQHAYCARCDQPLDPVLHSAAADDGWGAVPAAGGPPAPTRSGFAPDVAPEDKSLPHAPSWGMPARGTNPGGRPAPRRTSPAPAGVSPSLTARHKLPSAPGTDPTPRGRPPAYPSEERRTGAFPSDSLGIDLGGMGDGPRIVPPSPRRRGSTAGARRPSGATPAPPAYGRGSTNPAVPQPGAFGRGSTNPAAPAPPVRRPTHPGQGMPPAPVQNAYPPAHDPYAADPDDATVFVGNDPYGELEAYRNEDPYGAYGANAGADPYAAGGSFPPPPAYSPPATERPGSYSMPSAALNNIRRSGQYTPPLPQNAASGGHAPIRRTAEFGGSVPGAGFSSPPPAEDLPVYDPNYGLDDYIPPPPNVAAPTTSFEEDQRREQVRKYALIGSTVVAALIALLAGINWIGMVGDTATLERTLSENILANGLPTPVLPKELGDAIDELGIQGKLVARYSTIDGATNTFRAGVKVKQTIAFIPRTYVVERTGTFVVADQLATLRVYAESGWELDSAAQGALRNKTGGRR